MSAQTRLARAAALLAGNGIILSFAYQAYTSEGFRDTIYGTRAAAFTALAAFGGVAAAYYMLSRVGSDGDARGKPGFRLAEIIAVSVIAANVIGWAATLLARVGP
jgi:hypothetical protein